MRKLAFVLVAASLALPGSAWADGGRLRDADEQPFCETPDPCPDNDYIDFDRVMYGHGRTEGMLRHGIHTREGWKTKDMGGPHGVTMYFAFDTDGDRGVERVVRMRRKHGELQAQTFRGKHLRKRVGGPLRVWRPDRRTIKVRIPLRRLGDDLDSYGWNAGWYQRETACPGSCHSDSAPHNGWYTHDL